MINLFRSSTILLLLLFTVFTYAQDHNIIDYGVVPDGVTLNTENIQSAMDDVSEKGGGKIVFPKGRFLTGPIIFKSNVELHLEEGAVLLGSTNPDDYYSNKDYTGEINSKKKDNFRKALVLAEKVNNISLTGKGTIDGQGRNLALAIDSLHHAGVRVDPKYNYRRLRPNESIRPKLFAFSECKGVTISGLNLKNSACWGLEFELCSELILDRLNFTNRAYWNNDGFDITDCRNVKVTNCNLDTADDSICLKSKSSEHYNDSIYIANCTVRSSASAIKFGTASRGGFKNVTIEHIKIFDTYRSAIAIESVDGGDIENIKISNILAENTGNAIFIRLGQRSGDTPGTIKNIHIKDIKVQIPIGRPDIDYDLRARNPITSNNPIPSSIVGFPENIIENVVLENIDISFPGRATKPQGYIPLSDLKRVPEKIDSYPEFTMFGELPAWGFYVRHVDGITFKNVRINARNADFRPAYVFDDVQNISIIDSKITPVTSTDQLVLKDTKNVSVSNLTVDGEDVSKVPTYGKNLDLIGIQASIN